MQRVQPLAGSLQVTVLPAEKVLTPTGAALCVAAQGSCSLCLCLGLPRSSQALQGRDVNAQGGAGLQQLGLAAWAHWAASAGEHSMGCLEEQGGSCCSCCCGGGGQGRGDATAGAAAAAASLPCTQRRRGSSTLNGSYAGEL